MPIQLSGSLVITGSITTTGGITISGSILSASYSDTASFSNNFRVLGNLTASTALVTGTLTAQTLVVQTVTSSIVYSSGSNIFGNQLSDRQTFTGSVNITGSLALAGNITGNAATLTGALGGTSATFSGNLNLQGAVTRNINFYDSSNTNINAQIQYDQISSNSGQLFFGTNNAGTFATRLTISNTGAATFSSTVTATQFNVSTSGGTTQIYNTGGGHTVITNATANKDMNYQTSGTGGHYLNTAGVDRLIISSTGAATFAAATQDAIQTVVRMSGNNASSQIKALDFKLTAGTPLWTISTAAVGTDAGINIMPNGSAGLSLAYSTGAAVFSSTVQGNGGVFSGTGASATTMGGKAATASGLTDKDLTLSAWYATSGTNEYGGDLYLAAGRPTGGGSGKYGTVYIQAGIASATANVAGSVGTVIAANNTLLQFFTAASVGASPTEKMRVTYTGYTKMSSNGTYANDTLYYHEMRQTGADWNLILQNTSATGATRGVYLEYTAYSPNGVANYPYYFTDSTAVRFYVASNGGIYNYQSNNSNLSDIRTKKDIAPLESYWNKFKDIEIVKFKYKDQTHEDYNIGVIAQQVEAVAPEFVDVDSWDMEYRLEKQNTEKNSTEEPMKSIYTADLYHATIKVLQEAMAKIETLEAKVTALETK
jgi:hypothetical protein